MELVNKFAQDAQGNAIPSPVVYVYSAGTTTLASPLFTSSGSALNNPFTGGDNGLVQFSTSDGEYDVRIVGAGRDYTLRVRLADAGPSFEDYSALRAYSGPEINAQILRPGLSGKFCVDALDTTSADNGGTIIVGADGRRWRRDFSGEFNLQWFGGSPVAADNSQAIQLSFDAVAAAGGGKLKIPAGRYVCANNATLMRIKSSIHIVGDGMDNSVIVYNDSASTSRRDVFRTFNDTGDFDITFEDLAIESDWGAGGSYAQRSHLMELHTAGVVRLYKCRFSDSRYMGTVIIGARHVHVTGCEYLRMPADGCRPVGCDNVIVEGNYFKDVNDDSVAAHSMDGEPSPIQNSVIVANNRFVDSQGVAVLGAKHVSITGNVMSRMHTRAILVGKGGDSEGNTALLSVNISENVIDTVFDGFAFSSNTGSSNHYITVDSRVPTEVPPGFIGLPNGAGGIVQPYDYLYRNNTDVSPPATGAWFITIANNICVRSLGPVAKYSDYGFGARYGRSGPVDPQITISSLGNINARANILVMNHGYGVKISGNTVDGMDVGIRFNASSSAYVAWINCDVSNNKIGNFRLAGINVNGSGIIETRGNDINGDPYHNNPQRLLNGKWSSSFDSCAALWVDGSNCRVSVIGSTFRNVGTLYRGASAADAAWRGNVIYANPVVFGGYSADNIGIGNYPSTYINDAQLVIEDGDPSSSTYGSVLNVCLNSRGSLPTSGKYPARYFVRNEALTTVAGPAGSQYAVLGWVRLTTGSSHVLNTDWRELRCLTGT